MVRSARMSEKPQPIRSHTFERTVLVITVLLLITAAICLSIMISHFHRRQAANRITLANGTQVELLGTVLGDAPFNIEKPWQKFARQYLPGRLKNLVPAEFAADRLPGMDSNYLSVFLRVSAVSPALGSFPWGSADPEDAAGFLYLHSWDSSVSSGAWSNAVCRLIFTSYPRRQSDFFLRFADRTGAAIGKLPVPNPSTGPFPHWHAMPVPQTQTNGPVVLTLLSLEEQLGAVGIRPDLGGLNYWAMIFPQTHLVSKDPKWARAWPDQGIFRDATGNAYRLSRSEPVWKVRILVYRNSPASFGPDEELVVTNLALPAPGTYLTLNQGTNLGGVGVKVRFLAGAGKLTLTSNTFVSMKPRPSSLDGLDADYSGAGTDDDTTESWYSTGQCLLIETTNTQPDDRLEVFFHYDAGNDPSSAGNLIRTDNPHKDPFIQHINFTPPRTAKSLTVIVLVNRPVPFEFYINPADIQTEKRQFR